MNYCRADLRRTPAEPVTVWSWQGSFDCVFLRFADENFAQDDNVLMQ
jgi:hypothetical protein